jgi:hypothetical protein
MRDFQRSRVYRAEGGAWGDRNDGLSIAELQKFCDVVLESREWRRVSGVRKITILSRRGNGASALYWFQEIKFGVGAPHSVWLLLHEMAHIAVGIGGGHGERFCEIYLGLVRKFIGNGEAAWLKNHFLANKVKFREKSLPVG